MTLALLIVAMLVMAVPSAAVADDTPLKIVAFGDSLTSGHRLPSRQAYPAVLEAELEAAGVPADVENHGVDSETSAGGLRRLDNVLDETPDILIIAFGANDGLRGVPVRQMHANLARMIEAAQARGIAVLLVGMEALPLHGWQYTIDFHHVFPELAAKYKVPFVPFMLNGVFGNPDLIARDGVHPNAAGAKVIAANIFTEILPLAQKLAGAAK